MSYTRQDWADALLDRGGWPKYTANRMALEAWIEAEGCKAKFNPLATTKKMPGSTNFNAVPVQNYESFTQGIEATYLTITSGAYGTIIHELIRGTSALRLTQAVDASRWGTKLAYRVYTDLIATYIERSRTAIPQ